MSETSNTRVTLQDALNFAWRYIGPLPMCGGGGGINAPAATPSADTGAGGGGAAAAPAAPATEQSILDAAESQAAAADAAAATPAAAPADGSAAEAAARAAQAAAPAEGEAAVAAPAAEGEQPPTAAAAAPAAPAAAAAPSPMEVALNEVYKKYPAVKEFLGTHPELKPHWFKASEFNKLFPTVDDAKIAKDWALRLSNFDDLYYNESREAAKDFLGELWKNSLRQPDQPYHPSSNPSTGAYERVANQLVSDTLSRLHQMADQRSERAGWTPDQARVAIEGLAKMLGATLEGADGGFTGGVGPHAAAGTPSATSPQGAPAWETQLRAREAALARREQEVTTRLAQEFENSLLTHLTNVLSREADLVMKPAQAVISKLAPGVQKYVRQQIVQRVADAVDKDSLFERQYNAALRAGDRGPEHTKALRDMLETRAQLYFPDIAREVLGEVGYQAIARQEVRDARTAAAAANHEPVTTASPGRLSGGPPAGSQNSGGAGKYPPGYKPTGNYDKDFEALVGGL